MPNLFQTVSRIAKRGRKRWLGLVFVTQHPQHLPDELLGLLNNYILHRINDANTISRLRRSIGGIDAGLWERVTSLAPGQAVVSFTHPAARCWLRLIRRSVGCGWRRSSRIHLHIKVCQWGPTDSGRETDGIGLV